MWVCVLSSLAQSPLSYLFHTEQAKSLLLNSVVKAASPVSPLQQEREKESECDGLVMLLSVRTTDQDIRSDQYKCCQSSVFTVTY